MLELLGVPYVGSTPAACRLAFDKPTAKALAGRGRACATRASVALPHATFRELGAGAVLDAPGRPARPAAHGQAGPRRLRARLLAGPHADELPAAMVGCFAYGDTALVERFVDGHRGRRVGASTPATDRWRCRRWRSCRTSGSYDYAARYTAGATEFFAPARLERRGGRRARRGRGGRAHARSGCATCPAPTSSSTPTGPPWFLEVNVAPGMTETCLLPQAAEAAGLELGELYRALVERAWSR